MNPLLAKFAGRALLASAHKHFPILDLGRSFPGITLVSRRSDVLEVLDRPSEFSVANYGVRFHATFGQFALGMQSGPEYQRELSILRSAVRPEDAARVRAITRKTVEDLVENALRYRSFVDLIADVSDPLALRYMEEFCGVPDPGHGLLLRWHQMISFYIFGVYLITGPRVEVTAIRAAEQLRTYTEQLVTRRRQEPRDGRDQTILDRLLRWDDGDARLSDADVARQLTGIVSGGLIAPFLLVANVLDRIFDLPPEQFQGARQAALHDEDQIVREYVLEAARLAPFPGLIWRYCEADTVLARGTARERAVPAGTVIALFITAANRDPSAISEPERFILDRPAEEKLLFGHGTHACIGEHIGTALVTQFLKSVLAQPELHRAAGIAGRLTRGPKGTFPQAMFPASLRVELRHPSITRGESESWSRQAQTLFSPESIQS